MTKAPPVDGVIVGPSTHPIVPILAARLRDEGLNIVATNGGGTVDRELVEGVPLLAADGRVPSDVERRVARRSRRAERLEQHLISRTHRRSLERFESSFGPRERASVTAAIRRGEYSAAIVATLQPRFVWLNHVFQFGDAVPLIEQAPVLAMPWGGDIFDIGPTTPLSKRLVTRALRHASAVVPSATSAVDFLTSTYGTEPASITPLSWGVDLTFFRRDLAEHKAQLRTKLDLPADATVVFNSRRLKAAWGSDGVLAVMFEVAESRPETHHIIISGDEGAASARDAMQAARERGLGDRFHIVDRDVSMHEYLEFCMAADVGLSLRTTRDLRSLSLLQCAAAGLDIVVSDQPEYRAMEADGFRARFVDPDDPAGVRAATLAAVDASPGETAAISAAGRRFVDTHEDRDVQMQKLVELIQRTARPA